MTSESQVAAERAVNVVGAEAQLVASDRAVGLTSESQVAAERAVNIVGAEAQLVASARQITCMLFSSNITL